MIITVVDPRPTLNVAPTAPASVVIATAAGPQGPAGASDTPYDDIPSLTLIFENGLV